MNGSLALCGGILHLARHARTAEIRTYDLDGGRIGEGFRFAGCDGGAASADGIAVDVDMRIWVADRTSKALRRFTVFGAELEPWRAASSEDLPGHTGEPASVAVVGVEGDARVLVGTRGARRHAVQWFDRDGRRLASLRSRGDPQAAFDDVVRVALDGRFALVCEQGSGLVQVFRDGESHCALRPPRARHARRDSIPRAAHALSDGRFVVATGGEENSGVHLLDRNGRVRHTICHPGQGAAEVFEPCDIAIDEGDSDRRTRVAVVDSDGDRVQVFTLEGVCYGSFSDLPRADGLLFEEAP
ncbi:MAG: hypothetical protein JNL28_05795 [Planctomycetes bacterium]|nr:hypothetical protein [Planctomycetota bacterium]